MKKLKTTLQEIFTILLSCGNITFDKNLILFKNDQIITPIGDMTPILLKQKSKLENEVIDLTLLKKLMSILESNKSIIRLNHIGFGYKVSSQKDERNRLINLTRKTNQYLYEEESNDIALWLFLGNTQIWENPLIEFCPIEQNYPESDYFLPHIQIDIDTLLNPEEIEHLIKTVFNKKNSTYSPCNI